MKLLMPFQYLCPFLVYQDNVLQHGTQNEEETCHEINVDSFHVRNSRHSGVDRAPYGGDCQKCCDAQPHPGGGGFAVDKQGHPGHKDHGYTGDVYLYQIKTHPSFECKRRLKN